MGLVFMHSTASTTNNTWSLCVTITLKYSGRRNCTNSCLQYYIRLHHVIRVCLPSQSETKKHNQEKKPTNLCTPQTNVSAMFDNHKILFWLSNKQTFRILSLHNLLIVLCSLDLDVLRVQRIIGSFYLNHPQLKEVRKSDHMIRRDCGKPTTSAWLNAWNTWQYLWYTMLLPQPLSLPYPLLSSNTGYTSNADGELGTGISALHTNLLTQYFSSYFKLI